ncbi:MAG: glycosyltransferase [Solirubrobacteraceae bacterium]
MPHLLTAVIASPDLSPPPVEHGLRPEIRGKFLYRDGRKFYVCGVTYGPFRPGPDGEPYDAEAVERDFTQIAACGFNALRTYTPPPVWLLDAAQRHGLLVLAGLAWEQHIAFLAEAEQAREIVRRVAGEVALRAGHPALLGWAVGNEIPAPVVRWYGAPQVTAFLERLTDAVKSQDPGALVTYVSYPSTEYLDLGPFDLVCFNVFLERPETFEAYLARLQNVAEDRPLLLTEVGLDSGTHGEDAQARALDWQLRGALAGGCAGAFVFAWTDEWHRGGQDIEDWHFGLTDRERRPKPALAAVREAFADAPVRLDATAPRFSLVICTYNGAATLEETLDAVGGLDYPAFEVIVIDDGSTDASADIASLRGHQVISTPNRGLSSARNTGLQAASGDIVAYLDDDAAPDPHWLTYLALGFRDETIVAVGGPNVPVPGDGAVADAVAMAPGNPTHVLTDDRVAEHIPGCNCAFRRDSLVAIGGFDAHFRVAGDDVDVCWRMQDAGGTIGFSPAAVVFHHRRGSVRGYLRQQRNYGRAEAMLERKWPERYSDGGHVTWRGRLYGQGNGRRTRGPMRWRVYHGVWGTAPFQRLYEPARGEFDAVSLMPEVYLAIGLVAVLVALGVTWAPLLAFAAPLAVAVGLIAARAVRAAGAGQLPTPGLSPAEQLSRRALVALLHVLQPLVRLEGRVRHGLTPWRRRGTARRAWPVNRELQWWSETWRDPVERVRDAEAAIVASDAVVRRGGDFTPWDLEVPGGTLAGVRLVMLVEEHGQGQQFIRLSSRPVWSRAALAMVAALAALGLTAALDGALVAAAALAALAAALGARTLAEGASATATVTRALADRQWDG